MSLLAYIVPASARAFPSTRILSFFFLGLAVTLTAHTEPVDSSLVWPSPDSVFALILNLLTQYSKPLTFQIRIAVLSVLFFHLMVSKKLYRNHKVLKTLSGKELHAW